MTVEKYELLEYQIIAVAIERDDDGKIIGKAATNPATFHTQAGVVDFMERFEAELNG